MAHQCLRNMSSLVSHHTAIPDCFLQFFSIQSSPVLAKLTDILDSRLDLRPGYTAHSISSEHNENLAPPLALGEEDHEVTSVHHGNRLSRLFDVNRLRHAPVEERIEALRQIRAHTEHQEISAPEATVTDRPHAAKLTDKLKDKFRIRTRPQAAR